ERIVDLLESRARALGFVPQAQTLEVHGLCADCVEAKAAQA
ncbi:MAG: transcriptional repressor, partial [Lysobacter sp.]|nr:transcriptional repressor [Lysobacter sp.]